MLNEITTDVGPGATPERESREWWAAHDGGVHRVTGYSCAPNSPHYWWVPQLGHSMSDQHHLFASRVDALGCVIKELELLAVETQERLTALRLQRSLLGDTSWERVTASPEDQMEAFLRTLGKWTEDAAGHSKQ